jgi:putative transposase
LQHRLTCYVKGEVRRILNRIVFLYKPDTIVVENLRSFLKDVINNFPRSVKRILIRFGLGEIRKKLSELEEEYGIKVIRINPAYSSQSCSNCGYVDGDNRKTRDEFQCLCCGSKLHADVNGARNLRERLSNGWAHLYRMEQALSKQVKMFLDNLNTERYKCLWGKARSLLTQNHYFKKVLSNSSLTRDIVGYVWNI